MYAYLISLEGCGINLEMTPNFTKLLDRNRSIYCCWYQGLWWSRRVPFKIYAGSGEFQSRFTLGQESSSQGLHRIRRVPVKVVDPQILAAERLQIHRYWLQKGCRSSDTGCRKVADPQILAAERLQFNVS